NGETLRSETKETIDDGSAPWAGAITRILDDWRGALGTAPSAIGLAAPGLAARNARSIAWMPGRMQRLEGLNWTEALGGGVVRVLNDGHAALLGEAWRGAARGARNAVMLTLGTGVGGAAMCDGRLLRGTIGRAGHVGHMSLDPNGPPDITGTPGSLEDAIGNCTLEARSDGRFKDTQEMLAAAQHGDEEAGRIWARSIHVLGAGIVSLINLFDPEIVVLGGGVAKSGEELFGPLRGYVERHEWRPGGHAVKLAPAELGENAGALGAARYAMTFGDDV
ncbi:MAG: glucokinase, partial [Caulobacteraceae bacterium]